MCPLTVGIDLRQGIPSRIGVAANRSAQLLLSEALAAAIYGIPPRWPRLHEVLRDEELDKVLEGRPEPTTSIWKVHSFK